VSQARVVGADPEVRVFLSWSGETSRLLANALADGMRILSDRIDPWLSEDLEPGGEWARMLIPQIRKARLAVLCLTVRNAGASWISFETGVYYTSRLRKGVIPYLLDFTDTELPFPLGLFQSLHADWRGTKALFVRVGQLAGIDEAEVEERFATDIWPQLNDQLGVIRKLRQAPETGNPRLGNLANAYYLGHDLRWTMEVARKGEPPADVKHGLVQILHQAHELGLGATRPFRLLTEGTADARELPDEHWTDETREAVLKVLSLAFDRWGELLISEQPSYRAYPGGNESKWLSIQAEGRA
jgi:hypothetical protein